jgi:hypothetical protein
MITAVALKSLVGAIPRWAKVAAREVGAMTAIETRDVILLSVAPLEATGPSVTRKFSLTRYALQPDECWREVLAAYKGPPA